MSRLWAPWRIEYIRTKKDEGCIFCNKSSSNDDQNDLVLFRGKESFVLMNLYPYSNGHLMISPYLHSSDTNDLSASCNEEIMRLANESMKILKNQIGAEAVSYTHLTLPTRS